MKCEDFLNDFVAECFDEVESDLDIEKTEGYLYQCPGCKTGFMIDDIEKLNDCDDYDDYDYDELDEMYEDAYYRYVDNNYYEETNITCQVCGSERQHLKIIDNEEIEHDIFFNGSHVQTMKDSVECPKCTNNTNIIVNGYFVCACRNCF